MAYYFYLDKMLLPIPPEKMQLKVNSKNKTLTLINEGEINILKKVGLTDIDFDVLIPQVNYPFATYSKGFQKASVFLNKFEQLKTSQEPFQFIVSRTMPNGKVLYNTNMKVSLEDYIIDENAGNGFDLKVPIKLKQYREFGTKTVDINISSSKPKASVRKPRPATNSPAPKKKSKTYTVKKGDCLWNISKKYYGNGSKYRKIYNANKGKIKNPNLIYPGQKFTIPV